MKASRLIPLVAVLLLPIAFGAFGPRPGELRPAAVRMDLPGHIGAWQGETDTPSVEEKTWLAADTSFAKRVYWQGSRDGIAALREVRASIVLSGEDANGSIHRPERCLQAQGFQQLEPSDVEIDLGGGTTLTARRVRSFQELPAADGSIHRVANLNYYWFVGSDLVTCDHYTRTLRDMRDRLVGGFSQRWAYFTLSTNLTDNLPDPQPRGEREADRLLAELAREIYHHCVHTTATGHP